MRPDALRSPAPPRRTRRWAGLAAFAWAGVFALMSLYWAAGGMVGGDTLGVEIERLARERDASFVAGLWAAFALKAVAAALALALVRRSGRRLTRRLLLVSGAATGAAITLYGVANLVQHVLMAAGAITIPGALGKHAVAWHLALWDPFWILGGLLFLAAARGFQRSDRRLRAAMPPAGDAEQHPGAPTKGGSTMPTTVGTSPSSDGVAFEHSEG